MNTFLYCIWLIADRLKKAAGVADFGDRVAIHVGNDEHDAEYVGVVVLDELGAIQGDDAGEGVGCGKNGSHISSRHC